MTTQSKSSQSTESAVWESLLELPGIGKVSAQLLSEYGVDSPRDLLYLLPRRYDDRRTLTPICELQAGARVVTSGTVASVKLKGPPWRQMMELQLQDGDASLFGVWFSKRRPKPERFVEGTVVALAGLVVQNKKNGRLQIAHPVVIDDPEEEEHRRVVPVYPQIPKVTAKTIEKALRHAVENVQQYVADPIPKELTQRQNLMGLYDALAHAHRPTDIGTSHSTPIFDRLAYDELFFSQLATGLGRRQHGLEEGYPVEAELTLANTLGDQLGFEPTAGQKKVWGEIARDLEQTTPMRRLVHGDVGSGKTFIALLSLIATATSGLQAAFMAPTELLANQHFSVIQPVLEHHGISSLLLTSGLSAKERVEALAQIENGEAQVIIGTHALIQKDVHFKRLGLAVIDEQHRFGVMQRAALTSTNNGGAKPHLLVLSATPIPRSLALTMYGDLDLSLIDDMPPGRHPVETYVLAEEKYPEILDTIQKTIDSGRQVYYVCPSIVPGSRSQYSSTAEIHKSLSKEFAAGHVGLVHGQLSTKEKIFALKKFTDGKTNILVATTVVEVGMDVGNATMMIVDGAECFGLAQLHQLRGRVGRSHHASSCHLIIRSDGDEVRERLSVMQKTSDGMEIATHDLKLRGPGSLYGTSQSGALGFLHADLSRHGTLLTAAAHDVRELLDGPWDNGLPQKNALLQELKNRIKTSSLLIAEEAG